MNWLKSGRLFWHLCGLLHEWNSGAIVIIVLWEFEFIKELSFYCLWFSNNSIVHATLLLILISYPHLRVFCYTADNCKRFAWLINNTQYRCSLFNEKGYNYVIIIKDPIIEFIRTESDRVEFCQWSSHRDRIVETKGKGQVLVYSNMYIQIHNRSVVHVSTCVWTRTPWFEYAK